MKLTFGELKAFVKNNEDKVGDETPVMLQRVEDFNFVKMYESNSSI